MNHQAYISYLKSLKIQSTYDNALTSTKKNTRMVTHFLIDTSGSMAGSRINTAIECMKLMLDQVYKHFDLVTYSTFNNEYKRHLDYMKKSSVNWDIIETKIRAHLNGSTALCDALLKVVTEFPYNSIYKNDHKTIIVITDGEENCSNTTFGLLTDKIAKRKDVNLLFIGVGLEETNILNTLCTLSPENCHFINTPKTDPMSIREAFYRIVLKLEEKNIHISKIQKTEPRSCFSLDFRLSLNLDQESLALPLKSHPVNLALLLQLVSQINLPNSQQTPLLEHSSIPLQERVEKEQPLLETEKKSNTKYYSIVEFDEFKAGMAAARSLNGKRPFVGPERLITDTQTQKNPEMFRVWIGNLTSSVTTADIQQLCERFGRCQVLFVKPAKVKRY